VTYQTGWLQKRISETAKEYDTLPATLRDALKLETSERISEINTQRELKCSAAGVECRC
jgi:hypothetical protein